MAFQLINDSVNRVVRIGVYTHPEHKLINDDAYYSYEVLEKALKNKLHNLFFVNAERRYDITGKEEFFFNRADIYEKPTLDRFLKLIDGVKIMYDIRIGSYKTPGRKNYGKPHDHGSGFRIKSEHLCELYEIHETVK